jgi:hypothetical protein
MGRTCRSDRIYPPQHKCYSFLRQLYCDPVCKPIRSRWTVTKYSSLGPSLMASACILTFERIVWCVIPLEQQTWKLLWFDTRYFHIFFAVCSLVACFFQVLGACLTGSLFTDMIISNGTEPTGIVLLKAGLFIQLICYALFILVGLRFSFTSRTWMTIKTQRYPLPNSADLVRLYWAMQLAVIVIAVCFLRPDSHVAADTIDRDGQSIV